MAFSLSGWLTAILIVRGSLGAQGSQRKRTANFVCRSKIPFAILKFHVNKQKYYMV
jgi:hypothetical protein